MRSAGSLQPPTDPYIDYIIGRSVGLTGKAARGLGAGAAVPRQYMTQQWHPETQVELPHEDVAHGFSRESSELLRQAHDLPQSRAESIGVLLRNAGYQSRILKNGAKTSLFWGQRQGRKAA